MRAMRWIVLCVGLAVVPVVATTREARASVSVAITFEDLLRRSSAVVVGTAIERRSQWEDGRIYTYSRLHVDSPLAGELHPDDEVWVRTMGGVVGKIGQAVDGEAELTVGRPSLLFIRPSPVGAYIVTARGQGQYGLYTDEQQAVRARAGAGSGDIVPPHDTAEPSVLAKDMIHGRVMTDVARDVASAWGRTHAG